MRTTNVYGVILITFFIGVSLTGCGGRKRSPGEMYKWMNNPQNGLIQTSTSGYINYRLKYIPPEILAYRESLYSNPNNTYDSLCHEYNNALTFLLKISITLPDGETVDPALGLSSNYGEYSNIINEMSFNMREYIWLLTGDDLIYPDLAHFESTVEVQNEKTFYIVFSRPEELKELMNKRGNIDFVFNDLFFGTGINHFQFRGKAIKNIPKLKLKKKKT